jgi:hypothetical protein
VSGAKGGRPRGAVRLALLVAMRDFESQGVAATWRDLAIASCVGYRAARLTCWNMVASGELMVVGSRSISGCRRPLALFRLKRVDWDDVSAIGLAEVLASWGASQ